MDMEKAKNFVYRNARPLELARWRFLFEGGDRETVLEILASYQNADGGFGYGLEPDCWNPASSPVQTWAATAVLREVGLEDPHHPIIRGIVGYLSSGADFDGHLWRNTIPSNNDWPHAPWWACDPEPERSYNPTASLAGFLLKYAPRDSEAHRMASRLVGEAVSFLKAQYPLDSMHTVACYAELCDYLYLCNHPGAPELEALLHRQIPAVLTRDTGLWDTEYVCKPSLFVCAKSSPFYEENRELCSFEREFLSRTQRPNGTWNIPWAWEAYPEEWHISKNWWKADQIVKNVKFYRAMQESITYTARWKPEC